MFRGVSAEGKEYAFCSTTFQDQIEDLYFSVTIPFIRYILLNYFGDRVVAEPLFPTALSTTFIAMICLYPCKNCPKPLTIWKFLLPNWARCEMWDVLCVFDVELSRLMSIDCHPMDPFPFVCATVRISMDTSHVHNWGRKWTDEQVDLQYLPFILLAIRRHRLPFRRDS